MLLPKPVKGLTKELASKLISVCASFAVVFTAYILIVKYEWLLGVKLFYIATALLFVICFILNGGFGKTLPTPDMLRQSWSEDKKLRFIKRLTAGKKWAKRLMYPLLPMLIAVMIDLVYLFWLAE